MTPHRGYYALVQYCPNPSRLESANIGVILYCPELRFLDLITSQDNQRPRKFFGVSGIEIKRLNDAKRSFQDRLGQEREKFRSLRDLQAFARTRANDLLVSEVRPIRVESPEQQLKSLFIELVGRGESRAGQGKKIPQLESFFRRPEFQSKVEFNKEVILPISGRVLTAPYYYRNGKHNLIRPESFSGDPDYAIEKAERLGAEGSLLAGHSQNDGLLGLLRIVATFDKADDSHDVKDQVLGVLKYLKVDVYTRPQIDMLLREVQSELAA